MPSHSARPVLFGQVTQKFFYRVSEGEHSNTLARFVWGFVLLMDKKHWCLTRQQTVAMLNLVCGECRESYLQWSILLDYPISSLSNTGGEIPLKKVFFWAGFGVPCSILSCNQFKRKSTLRNISLSESISRVQYHKGITAVIDFNQSIFCSANYLAAKLYLTVTFDSVERTSSPCYIDDKNTNKYHVNSNEKID